MIDLLTRKVEITHIGCQYSGGLMFQISRYLTDCFNGFLVEEKWMLHDQDPLFTRDFRELLRASGYDTLQMHRPMMNGHAECFVKTIKRECLNKMIFFGVGTLRHAIDEFIAQYHKEHPHQGLENKVIEQDAETFRNTGPIRKNARLGGLLKHYYPDSNPEIEDEEAEAA